MELWQIFLLGVVVGWFTLGSISIWLGWDDSRDTFLNEIYPGFKHKILKEKILGFLIYEPFGGLLAVLVIIAVVVFIFVLTLIEIANSAGAMVAKILGVSYQKRWIK